MGVSASMIPSGIPRAAPSRSRTRNTDAASSIVTCPTTSSYTTGMKPSAAMAMRTRSMGSRCLVSMTRPASSRTRPMPDITAAAAGNGSQVNGSAITPASGA